MEEKALVVKSESVLQEVLGGSTEFLWTSIADDGSRASRAKVLNAIENADSFRDVKEPVPVRDVVIHNVSLENEDGEPVQAVRVVFVGENGNYATVANGVVSSLKKIFGIFGLPPWDPPLKVIPKEVKTRKGYRTLRVEVVE